MSLELPAENAKQQIAYLQSLMREADAEWEELTRLIQTDKELQAVLERHLEHSRLVLLQSQQHAGSTGDLAAQVAALQQQLAQLEHNVAVETVRRNAAMGRFDQARLVLATVRKLAPRQHRSLRQFTLRCWRLLCKGIKYLLHEVWLALQENGQWSTVIPPGQFW